MQLSRTHLQSVPSGLAASTPPLTRLSTSIATKGVCRQLYIKIDSALLMVYDSLWVMGNVLLKIISQLRKIYARLSLRTSSNVFNKVSVFKHI
ncbi:hypothetical protein MJO28_006288 [Puccinia striiformis f. sp. tritici]|uniref:Uncharacterized protein n=1 Tax=Puccinia striiformis f. sp. tritici TaxID=168172 RepID=A0ACC0EK06_9BASI|nr:hypothetical protein MJO28_006288 [Puccinia striiformis f. sp. tritici]